MFVPLELVNEVIIYLLDAPPRSLSPEEPGSNTKPAWDLINAFSLASKPYRTVALEAWFRRFYIESPEDIVIGSRMFPEIQSNWCREFHCVQPSHSKTFFWDIDAFEKLKMIRFDWLKRHSVPSVQPLEDTENFKGFPFSRSASTIPDLDLRGLGWPSPMAIHSLARSFLNLTVLRLRQEQIWCSLCNTCSISNFQDPGPDAIIYENGLGLPIHYSRALASLEKLQAVYITIAKFNSGKTILGNDADHNENFWTGECDRCMEVMYEDTDFRQVWVARKKDVTMKPPSLKTVEWRFWMAENEHAPGGLIDYDDTDFIDTEEEE